MEEVPYVAFQVITPSEDVVQDAIKRLTDLKVYQDVVNKTVSIGGEDGMEIGNSGNIDSVRMPYREIYINLRYKGTLFVKVVGLQDKIMDNILLTFKFVK